MKKATNLIEWVKQMPKWVKTVVGLASTVLILVSLYRVYQQNFPAFILVVAPLVAVIIIITGIYVISVRTTPQIIGGEHQYVYDPAIRISAALVILVTIISSGTYYASDHGRAEVRAAWNGTSTPTPTNTSPPTFTPTFSLTRTPPPTATLEEQGIFYMFVLDASLRMTESFESQTKWDAALRAVDSILLGLEDGANYGLVVIGGAPGIGSSNPCDEPSLLTVPFSTSKAEVGERLGQLQPGGGGSLYKAFVLAVEELNSLPESTVRSLIYITGSEDACESQDEWADLERFFRIRGDARLDIYSEISIIDDKNGIRTQTIADRIGSVSDKVNAQAPQTVFQLIQSNNTVINNISNYVGISMASFPTNTPTSITESAITPTIKPGVTEILPPTSILATTFTMTPTPTKNVPTIQPSSQPIRLNIPAGSTGISVPGAVNPQATTGYVLSASQGQTLAVKVTGTVNQVGLAMYSPANAVLKPMDATLAWTGTIPANGDYFIDVGSLTGSNVKQFTLEVSLVTPPPPATLTPVVELLSVNYLTSGIGCVIDITVRVSGSPATGSFHVWNASFGPEGDIYSITTLLVGTYSGHVVVLGGRPPEWHVHEVWFEYNGASSNRLPGLVCPDVPTWTATADSTQTPIPSPTYDLPAKFAEIDQQLRESFKSSIAYIAPDSMELHDSFTIQLSLNPSLSATELITQIVATNQLITATAGPTVVLTDPTGDVVTNTVESPAFVIEGGPDVTVASSEVEITNRMKAVLTSSDPDAFTIQLLHDDPEQVISSFETTDWRWSITAKKEGTKTLELVLYRLVQFEGNDYWRPVETYRSDIVVVVTPAQRMKELDWKWIIGIVVTLLLIPAFWRWYDERKKQNSVHGEPNVIKKVEHREKKKASTKEVKAKVNDKSRSRPKSK
jgi:hypothetical protein